MNVKRQNRWLPFHEVSENTRNTLDSIIKGGCQRWSKKSDVGIGRSARGYGLYENQFPRSRMNLRLAVNRRIHHWRTRDKQLIRIVFFYQSFEVISCYGFIMISY